MLYDTAKTESTWQDMTKQVPAIGRINDYGSSVINNFNCLGGQIYTRLIEGDRVESQQPEAEELWQKKIHEAMTKSSSWRKLVEKTAGNKEMAIAASVWISQSIATKIPCSGVNADSDLPRLRASRDRASKLGLTSLVDTLNRQVADLGNQYKIYSQGINTRTWVDRAVSRALDVLEGRLTPNSGWDDLPGVHNAKSLADKVQALDAYSGDRARRILLQLGRMSTVLGKARKSKKAFTSSVEYGNNIANLLAEEWIKEDPQFLLEYAEEKLAQYSKGKSALGRGPIIVLLDQSGSMDMDSLGHGRDREVYDIWAKAFTLLVSKIAKREKREVYCITFNSYVRAQIDLTSAVASEVATKILDTTPSGGTSWSAAISAAVNILRGKVDTKTKKFKDADVLLITDGQCHVYDEYSERLAEQKKNLNFKIQGILISSDESEAAAECLKPIADSIYSVTSLSDEQKLSAITNSL